MRRRKKAFKDPRVPEQPLGLAYQQLIRRSRDKMRATHDDLNIVCFGPTGSGKSTLAMQTERVWHEGSVFVEMYGFDVPSWAQALQHAKDGVSDFIVYDEANVSKRDSMASKNKAFIDLLFKIRYKNWCKWMNNPSGEYLDGVLIKDDIINFFIFIYAKQKRFYVFTRKGLQAMHRAHGNINGQTVREHGKEFAVLDSWFASFDDDAWMAYERLKEDTTDENLDRYIEENIGGEALSAMAAARELGVNKSTVYRHLDRLIASRLLDEDEVKNAAGTYRLRSIHLDLLRDSMRS